MGKMTLGFRDYLPGWAGGVGPGGTACCVDRTALGLAGGADFSAAAFSTDPGGARVCYLYGPWPPSNIILLGYGYGCGTAAAVRLLSWCLVKNRRLS